MRVEFRSVSQARQVPNRRAHELVGSRNVGQLHSRRVSVLTTVMKADRCIRIKEYRGNPNASQDCGCEGLRASCDLDGAAATAALDVGGCEVGAELDGAAAGVTEGFPAGAGALVLEIGEWDNGRRGGGNQW